MGQEEWAHLFWDTVVDSRQFFGTLTNAEDLAAGMLPVSNLATTRSIIQAHTVLMIQDTPVRWLLAPRVTAALPLRASKLGLAARTKQTTGERNSKGRGAGDSADSGKGAGGKEDK